jgi:hypothetical protein
MSSVTAQERHASHVVVRMMLELVDRALGEEAVTRVLTLAGEDRPFEVMVDDSGWSSFGQLRRLLEAAGGVLGDHHRIAEIATNDLTGGSMPSVTEMFQPSAPPMPSSPRLRRVATGS